MSTLFTNGKGIIQASIGSIIPPLYHPVDPNKQLVYKYTVSPSPTIIRVTGPLLPPQPSSVFKGVEAPPVQSKDIPATLQPNPLPQPIPAPPPPEISAGGLYNTGTLQIFMPAGMPVPPGWKLIPPSPKPTPPPTQPGTAPIDWSPVNTDDPTQPVSSGETYVSGDGQAITIPAGTPIPADWKPITSVVDLEAMPILPGDKTDGSSSLPDAWQLAGKIMTVVGVAGISYIGYLYVCRPAEIRAFLVRFEELKTLIVDTSQMLIAIALIVGISFVSYEFSISYAKVGTFAGAVADLLARTIEEFVTVFFDVLGDLIKDAWNYVIGDIKKIIPSWL